MGCGLIDCPRVGIRILLNRNGFGKRTGYLLFVPLASTGVAVRRTVSRRTVDRSASRCSSRRSSLISFRSSRCSCRTSCFCASVRLFVRRFEQEEAPARTNAAISKVNVFFIISSFERLNMAGPESADCGIDTRVVPTTHELRHESPRTEYVPRRTEWDGRTGTDGQGRTSRDGRDGLRLNRSGTRPLPSEPKRPVEDPTMPWLRTKASPHPQDRRRTRKNRPVEDGAAGKQCQIR